MIPNSNILLLLCCNLPSVLVGVLLNDILSRKFMGIPFSWNASRQRAIDLGQPDALGAAFMIQLVGPDRTSVVFLSQFSSV